MGILDSTFLVVTSDNGGCPSDGSNNYPLRGGKFDVFEGGYRVPCVVSWPNVIPAKTKVDQLVSTIDLLPTICAATGVNLPENKIDGVNVLELLKNKPQPELEDRFFYYHKSNTLFGVRQGKWKYLAPSTFNYIETPGQDAKSGKGIWAVEHEESLYNLDTDLREYDNRLEDFPEKADELKVKLAEFQLELDSEARPLGTFDNIN